MRKLLPLILLAACDNSWGPGSEITATCHDPKWTLQVEKAASVWNSIPGCGELLFVVPFGGHPVELYDGHDWDDSVGGRFDGDSARVRINLGIWEFPVLVHELGHALGLDHVSEEDDPYSIMNPSAGPIDGALSQGDIKRSREIFGCE